VDTAAGHAFEASVLQAELSLTQVLDKPVSGRIRPDQVSLIFGRKIIRKGPQAPPEVISMAQSEQA
jgi:hypothetical protein